MAGPGKKGRKFGRNADKCKRYKAGQRRERHKLKKIVKSNGVVAARAYASKHGLSAEALIAKRHPKKLV